MRGLRVRAERRRAANLGGRRIQRPTTGSHASCASAPELCNVFAFFSVLFFLQSTTRIRLGKDLAQSWTTREILHAAELHLEVGIVMHCCLMVS